MTKYYTSKNAMLYGGRYRRKRTKRRRTTKTSTTTSGSGYRGSGITRRKRGVRRRRR
uniref:Uncharacterized protein n=1 Tax=Adintovirus sp. TaxID=2835276 RepID=A0A8D9UHE6_9VIRU|nr:MAG TPA: hypothetical protein [Adintovirus sp.]